MTEVVKVKLEDIVWEPSIYPRDKWNTATMQITKENEPAWNPSIYYSCVTQDPHVLWTIRPDVEHGCGWIGKVVNATENTWDETGFGLKWDCAVYLLEHWGLPTTAKWAQRAAKAAPQEMVYVIGQGETGIVKIGRSIDLDNRLKTIQKTSPVPLRVLWQTPGGRELEKRLHKAFGDRRSHGEWFVFTGEDAIELIRKEVEGA